MTLRDLVGLPQMRWLDEIIELQVKVLNEKKDALYRQKLLDKGYEDLALKYSSQAPRFPKLHLMRAGNWDCMYADNGTDKGEFIVAVSTTKIRELKITTETSHRFELYFDVMTEEPQILNQDERSN